MYVQCLVGYHLLWIEKGFKKTHIDHMLQVDNTACQAESGSRRRPLQTFLTAAQRKIQASILLKMSG